MKKNKNQNRRSRNLIELLSNLYKTRSFDIDIELQEAVMLVISAIIAVIVVLIMIEFVVANLTVAIGIGITALIGLDILNES